MQDQSNYIPASPSLLSVLGRTLCLVPFLQLPGCDCVLQRKPCSQRSKQTTLQEPGFCKRGGDKASQRSEEVSMFFLALLSTGTLLCFWMSRWNSEWILAPGSGTWMICRRSELKPSTERERKKDSNLQLVPFVKR